MTSGSRAAPLGFRWTETQRNPAFPHLTHMDPETLTPDDVTDLGFSTEELALLRDAGVLIDEDPQEPWRPRSLGDVDWIAWKVKCLQAEIAAIKAQEERRVQQLQRAIESLVSRYGPDCEAVIREHLPRKRDGSFARKSLDLERTRQGLRSTAGGPRLVDEIAALAWIKSRAVEDGFEALGALQEAVQVTETVTGRPAIERLFTPGERKIKLLAAPVKSYVQSLPPVPDPRTGEAVAATIPGVEIIAAVDRWYFE